MTNHTTLADEFWSGVDKTGDCWLWLRRGGPQQGQPVKWYGRFRGRYTHRLAYELSTGTDPGPMQVLHRCDNPACVNPAHLFLGTQAENMADRNKKGRARGSVLDEPAVRQIRAHRDGGWSLDEIAERFDVSRTTVHQVCTHKTWKHVTGDLNPVPPPPRPSARKPKRWPRRVAGVPFCSECGMTIGHWAGCPER